jgi:hypothetical protein
MASIPKCDIEGCQEHYGCRLRNKGIQLSPKAQMSRMHNYRPAKKEPPAYNKTIIYEDRPGGTKMPLLNTDGSPVRQKQYDENKRQITSTIRATRNGALTP